MKKLVALVLCFCIWGSQTILDASGGSNSKEEMTASTTVTATIKAKYSILIPPSVQIPYGAAASNFNLSVTSFCLNPGEVVRVNVASGGVLRNQMDLSKVIPYQLKLENKVFKKVDFNGIGEKKLTVEIRSSAWEQAFAGTYSDTLTFTVSTPVQAGS